MKNFRLTGVCVVTATLLAACGGGGSDSPAVPVPGPGTPSMDVTQVPASSAATFSSYTAYGLYSVQLSSETTDPLFLDLITVAPTSETDDPVSL